MIMRNLKALLLCRLQSLRDCFLPSDANSQPLSHVRELLPRWKLARSKAYVRVNLPSKTFPSPVSTSLFRTTDGTWSQRITDSLTLIRGTGCLTLRMLSGRGEGFV